jgi:hypothetical protein
MVSRVTSPFIYYEPIGGKGCEGGPVFRDYEPVAIHRFGNYFFFVCVCVPSFFVMCVCEHVCLCAWMYRKFAREKSDFVRLEKAVA